MYRIVAMLRTPMPRVAKLGRRAAIVGFGLLVLVNCSTDTKSSEKLLTRSRDVSIAAARKIRHDTRVQAQPSETFFGNYYPCVGSKRVHYSLETDWITPKGDADDLRTLDYVVKTLRDDQWLAASAVSQREQTLHRRGFEIELSVKPGADWITGILTGPCYKLGDAAVRYVGRQIDHLSG
jgi:hypothetical protein